jgi:acetylornithine deacetylase
MAFLHRAGRPWVSKKNDRDSPLNFTLPTMHHKAPYFEEVSELLRQLIATPSVSREEGDTARLIAGFLMAQGFQVNQQGHNVWVREDFGNPSAPVLLLNSHHDTVKPVAGWTDDPFLPIESEGKLQGLGSNDAGGALVALMAAFLYLCQTPQPYQLILAATAEEEISGAGGIASILGELGPIDLAVVGEPTQCQMAIAEKGLLVLDVTVKGKAGHAAREEGINSIYEALPVIEWFKGYAFEKVSDLLGKVKMTVTQINAGQQHNVVPDTCQLVVDVRTNEHYSNHEIYDLICGQVNAEVKARSFRLNSSGIPPNHPVVARGLALGLKAFGSPTLSDQALIPFPSIKIGPGDSARSHTAQEHIYLHELAQGILTYIDLLNGLLIPTYDGRK